MTQWYYADAQRERQGPVDTDTLRARLSDGLIDASSLVWREGFPQWVALGEVAAELGIDTSVPATAAPIGGAPVDGAHAEPQATVYPTSVAVDHLPTGAASLAGPAADAALGQADAGLADHPGAVDHQQRPPSGHAAPADPVAWPTTPAAPATPAAASSPMPTNSSHAPATPPHAPSQAPAGAAPPGAWDSIATPAASVALHDAPVVYAGLWRRVAASILDSLITTFAVYLIVIPLVFVVALLTTRGDSGSALDDGSPLGIAILVMSYGIGLAIPTLYFAWMQSSRHQASLGKLACGIKLVRADSNGGRVGFWRNVLRYLAYMLISVLTLGIGAIVAAFMAGMSARKQAPHDKVCDTLVVDRWAFTDHPERQSSGLDTVTIVVLAIYAVLLVISVVVVGFMLAAIGMSQS
ncbi:RDD family protein [Xanthomonas arboricola]|uniref:RDD family protein n=1 Tax=Xanthomonas arboricola pv. guizotiae TaxID=487867 RepID=A0A2S6ZSP1_9XANT|nr:RDD family protein [Xanthomonas arboricola]PPT95427.1 RDD family protein [Xanthomonas arboricola pv. guizotiae]PPU19627.1 RDD family protein [Xanthomonas arboricola pv. guizotiae]